MQSQTVIFSFSIMTVIEYHSALFETLDILRHVFRLSSLGEQPLYIPFPSSVLSLSSCSFAAKKEFDKVKILWEGHKIWKNLPPVLTKQLFLLSSVKTSGRFFQIFVAFSEKLDFTIYFKKWRNEGYILGVSPNFGWLQ